MSTTPFRRDRLREVRVERGLSVTALARKAGVSKSFVSELENGRRSPSPETVAKLAGALRISTKSLLTRAAA